MSYDPIVQITIITVNNTCNTLHMSVLMVWIEPHTHACNHLYPIALVSYPLACIIINGYYYEYCCCDG